MKKTNYPNHYVAVLPLWLSRVLSKAEQPMSVATSYEKLCAILSPSDVCFYHLYQLKKQHYVGKAFDDMCSVALRDDNLAWLEKNASALMAASIEFDAMWKKHGNDIMGDSAPAFIRKDNYVPRASEDSTLLLVAESESPLGNARSFYRACIEELNKQMRFDRYKTLAVFKQYCVV